MTQDIDCLYLVISNQTLDLAMVIELEIKGMQM